MTGGVDDPYPLTPEHREAYARAGFVRLPGVFDAATLARFRPELGDVSFHSGWTFHRAGPNRTSGTREVMTVIYMDADMRLAAPRNRNQEIDRETWCPGAAVGERIETPLNPVLYP